MSRKPDNSRFQYNAMSSLVLTADRSALPRRDQEPTGEPETLVGRIDPKQMGSRAVREGVDVEKRKRKQDEERRKREEREERRLNDGGARSAAARVKGRHANVLQATQDLEGLKYRPRTGPTREIYEKLLTAVHGHLGDVPFDTARSAADYVLEILKDDSLRDLDRKRKIDAVTEPLSQYDFDQLVNLGKKITDYGAEEKDGADDPDAERRAGEVEDEETGVAVVFGDEDEEEEDAEGEGFEVRSEGSDDDDAEGDADEEAREREEAERIAAKPEDIEDDEALVIGGDGEGGASRSVQTDRLHPADIDGFWLQRLVSQSYPDPLEATNKTSAALETLSSDANTRDVENALVELFDYENFDLVKTLTKNRDIIVWCTKLARADADERLNVEVAMREKGVGWIIKALLAPVNKATNGAGAAAGLTPMDIDPTELKKTRLGKGTTSADATLTKRKQVDLDGMAFAQGSRLSSNKKVKLPQGSTKVSHKSYEEIYVPRTDSRPTGERVKITDLPPWTKPAFGTTTHLNLVQSKVYPIAFGTDEPILLCAPTGAGKTNVAVLTVLNEISKVRSKDGLIDKDAFKIVYVAPMKALVQEVVGNFRSRLAAFNITVNELTGDRQLTKQQIAETQIIVTTPEKWDVITRKTTDTSYTNLVRLIIIDEIHLLHDERGPVLESIVSRTIRRMEQTQDYVRLVGLSATLPNYRDVAAFLRVDPNKGLFFFDSTYRPCKLDMNFIGITEKRAITRYQVSNEVCYEKVLAQQKDRYQTLVFVHSRKDTVKTAKFLKDTAVEKETITQFLKADSATAEILGSEADLTTDQSLKELLPLGFAVHHAGMNRADRKRVEALFAEGHVSVLVSTATLAWGVNLPAHTVIIKGTQIYNPEKGRWVELSPQDVLQMLGRAGRPQFDEFGLGIIITNQSELHFHMSIMTAALPIESQLVAKLPDNLNAEIVLGTVRNIREAVQWLSYTYLYRRMLAHPTLYSVPADYREEDPRLEQKCADIAHTAAVLLEKSGLAVYDRKSGSLQTTELGRISSHYYVAHTSMATYKKHLSSRVGLVELFRVFALSDEFKFIPVREDEKMEVAKLLESVPIPVKEGQDSPEAKINCLLQAHVSSLKLDGYALVADMVYVTQSAGRILRALFEVCLKRGWASAAYRALDLCKMVEQHMWPVATPLRQMKGSSDLTRDIVVAAERKNFPWNKYFDLEPPELEELLNLPRRGNKLYKLVHQFPKLELQAQVLPLTHSAIRIELTITPDFEWNEKVHGNSLAFWVIVEDVDGEVILFHDTFLLHKQYANDEHIITFTVKMLEPLPPNYFVSVVADRWMHCEVRRPISFQNLVLPSKFAPPTPLLDLEPLPVAALHNREFIEIYSESIQRFNKIQTQVFQALYTTNDNVFVGAPTGSGKTICAEFALLRLWSQSRTAKAVCVEPCQDVVDMRVAEWSAKFATVQGGKRIVALTGETSADVGLLNSKDTSVIVCTPHQWDMLSRRWKTRPAVRNLGLLIADEIHLVGGAQGATYEVIISRSRLIAVTNTDKVSAPTRIVALGVPLGSARDMGDWIGATSQNTFNFSPGARPLPMEVHLQGFNVPHFPSLMIQMAKPTYLAVTEYAGDRPTIVFVPSRKQCYLSANDIATYAVKPSETDDGEDEFPFLNIEKADLAPHLENVQDEQLREMLEHGIGIYHEALSRSDKRTVERLFNSGAIQVVVASKDVAWSIPLSAYMVVIMGIQTYEGREHRYVDYPFTDVLQMMGRACRPTKDTSSRCVIMHPQVKKPFFQQFLSVGLPIESHVHLSLADHFNAEITSKVIENKQDAVDWCTWLFMYRRLQDNPNYYDMKVDKARGVGQALGLYLSELVERTMQVLDESKCIEVDDDDEVTSLNLGLIASHYNIQHVTLEVFSESLTEKTKLKGFLEIVSSSAEFESEIPIRRHEDAALKKIYDRVPVKLAKIDYASPYHKVFLLLQAHFSRLQLPVDLQQDLNTVLKHILKLLSALVQVANSQGFMNAVYGMELSQMVVQAMWIGIGSDKPLKQIPGFTSEIVNRCIEGGVESVYDIMNLEDDERNRLLQMSDKQVAQVARFCNGFPSITVSHRLLDADNLRAGAEIELDITLERDDDEYDLSTNRVIAPFYPYKKTENWWLVLGVPATRTLLAVKDVFFKDTIVQMRLKFTVPKQGDYKCTLSLICDSYVVDADRDTELELRVLEGEDSSDEDDDDEDEDMADA